jgi:predicted ferric reductase
MHPFTIVGTKPLEFCVKAHDGFTWKLHEYARRNPGGRLKASVEGPYGTFPDPMDYDKIILIAGGSGGSFTFGLAVNLLERMGEDCTKSIMFIWAVREHGES